MSEATVPEAQIGWLRTTASAYSPRAASASGAWAGTRAGVMGVIMAIMLVSMI
jgi:hypothetical protein